MAFLDVSAIDPALSESAHAVTGALTVMAARAIEERFFRDRFRSHWIIAVARPEGSPGILLAVDGDQSIVGANRTARMSLLREEPRVGGSLWSVFNRNVALFRRKDQSDIPVQLTFLRGNQTCFALVTPPGNSMWSATSAALHARPRLDLLGTLKPPASPPVQARGGVSPSAMRRLHDYVETHLIKSIDLGMLAGIARLSGVDVAPDFKQ